jgi:hypothetical protein
MRLVKLPDNSWVNPEEVVRIIETEQKTIQIRLANDEWIDIKGHNIDQVASVFLTPVFAVLDDDLVVNKSQVESIHIRVEDHGDGKDPRAYTELRMVSGRVVPIVLALDLVLDQLDGIPFFGEVE